MAEERNYSKREHDEFRRENKQQFETIMTALKEIRDSQSVDHKTLELLCRVSSENSGDIGELKKSHQLIKDIASFSKVTKWFFYLFVGLGTAYSIGKAILIALIKI